MGYRSGTSDRPDLIPALGRRARWWHRSWVALVAALAVVFVVANRSQAPAVWRAARGAEPGLLVGAAGLSLVRLAAEGQMQRASQALVGSAPGRVAALRLGAAAHFLNAIVKSGGMAGLAVYSADARRRGVSQGAVAVAYVATMVLADLALALCLVVGIGLASATGGLPGVVLVAVVVFALYIGGRLALIAYATRSPTHLQRLLALPHRILARFEAGRSTDAPFEEVAKDAFDAVSSLRRRPLAAAPVLAWTVGVHVLGAAELGVVLRAVGGARGLDVAVAGYTLSLLFGIVGLFPSGAGSAELSLGFVLVSYGSSGPEAAAAVALYRLVELWLPVALGAAAARGLAHRRA